MTYGYIVLYLKKKMTCGRIEKKILFKVLGVFLFFVAAKRGEALHGKPPHHASFLDDVVVSVVI